MLLLLDGAYRDVLALCTAQAWYRAVALGVFDGTDPRGVVTREMLAVVLGRCGLLGELSA